MPDEIKSPFEAATNPPPPSQDFIPVARPVSRAQIQALHKMISTPQIKAEFTPMGARTRQVRTERDEAIIKEIEIRQRQLELRRGAAKQAFTRAHETPTIRRGPKR